MTDETPPIKRSVGRPPQFESPEQLADLIDDYLNATEVKDYTLTGLCLHIGTTRVTLDEYLSKPEFKSVVSAAKAWIEHSYELRLIAGGPATGPIFGLKNFGWKDHINNQLSDPNGNPITLSQPIQVILPANGREAP